MNRHFHEEEEGVHPYRGTLGSNFFCCVLVALYSGASQGLGHFSTELFRRAVMTVGGDVVEIVVVWLW